MATVEQPINDSNADSILGINGFFASAALVVVCLRIYVRAVMLKTFGVDDYIICAAMVSSSPSFHYPGLAKKEGLEEGS